MYRKEKMVETERFVLLKPNTDDWGIISEILSRPKQTKYLRNKAPYSKTQQNDYLNRRIGLSLLNLHNPPHPSEFINDLYLEP